MSSDRYERARFFPACIYNAGCSLALTVDTFLYTRREFLREFKCVVQRSGIEVSVQASDGTRTADRLVELLVLSEEPPLWLKLRSKASSPRLHRETSNYIATEHQPDVDCQRQRDHKE